MVQEDVLINVVDNKGNILNPCTSRVAWVLVKRNRAIWLDDISIKIILTKAQIKDNKKAAIERDKRICHYCGKYIPPTETATADHIIPRTINKDDICGYDDLDNLVCACVSCNRHKDRTPYNEYVRYRITALSAILSLYSNLSVNQILENYFHDNSLSTYNP